MGVAWERGEGRLSDAAAEQQLLPISAHRFQPSAPPNPRQSFTCPDVAALEGNCGTLCDCVKKANPTDPK